MSGRHGDLRRDNSSYRRRDGVCSGDSDRAPGRGSARSGTNAQTRDRRPASRSRADDSDNRIVHTSAIVRRRHSSRGRSDNYEVETNASNNNYHQHRHHHHHHNHQQQQPYQQSSSSSSTSKDAASDGAAKSSSTTRATPGVNLVKSGKQLSFSQSPESKTTKWRGQTAAFNRTVFCAAFADVAAANATEAARHLWDSKRPCSDAELEEVLKTAVMKLTIREGLGLLSTANAYRREMFGDLTKQQSETKQRTQKREIFIGKPPYPKPNPAACLNIETDDSSEEE